MKLGVAHFERREIPSKSNRTGGRAAGPSPHERSAAPGAPAVGARDRETRPGETILEARCTEHRQKLDCLDHSDMRR